MYICESEINFLKTYFPLYNKNIRFDFADELKVRGVRCSHEI